MKTKLLSLLLFLLLTVTLKAQNVGVATTSPQSKLSVGAGSQFQVDSIGNIKKIRNVAYSNPASLPKIKEINSKLSSISF